ncbi:MAG: hypothetical protein PHX08_13360 [Lachnospiraceae bacterium]|nr:hypothetical protein [Lachnospiraceae bacterium]
MNRSTFDKTNSPIYTILAGCILLLILSLHNIGNVSQIFVLHDEFGYWYNAAHFAGLDWSGISGISSYYSYGYSFLLVPLFFIFHSSVSMYRAAIVLNGILLVASYLLSCKCAFLLFPDTSKKILSFFCLVSALYGGTIFSSNITWGEPLLTLMFWLIILTLIHYIDTHSFRFLLFLIMESVYLYTIHQRCIGIIVALILVFFIEFIRDKDNRKPLLILLALFACLFFIISLFKNSLVIWNSPSLSSSINVNDYDGQFKKLINFFTSTDFFFSVIQGFLSKIFYLCAASGLLVIWGVCHIIKTCRDKWKIKDKRFIVFLFVLLSVIILEAINALYFNSSLRIDAIIYGRYAEFAIGPLLLFGLCFLYQSKVSSKIFALGISIYLALSLPASALLAKGTNNMYLSSVVGNLFYNPVSNSMNIPFLIVIPLLIAIVLFVLFQYRNKYLYILAVAPLALLWIFAAQYTLDVDVNPSQTQAYGYTRFASSLTELGADVPIYFIYQGDYKQNNFPVERIQTILYDKTIQRIDADEAANLEGDYILFQYGLESLNMEHYTILAQTHGLVAVVPNTSSLAKEAETMQYEDSIFDASDRTNGIANYKNRYSLSSEHKEGFLTACNYTSLNAGTYEISLTFRSTEITDTSLGYFDITSDYGQNELLRDELTTAVIDEDGNATLTYTFTCDNVNFVEYRLYAYDTSLMELGSITYKRIK